MDFLLIHQKEPLNSIQLLGMTLLLVTLPTNALKLFNTQSSLIGQFIEARVS